MLEIKHLLLRKLKICLPKELNFMKSERAKSNNLLRNSRNQERKLVNKKLNKLKEKRKQNKLKMLKESSEKNKTKSNKD